MLTINKMDMSNHILITGSAGSGKTTLAKYFIKHGKNGVDADLSGVGKWIDREGNVIEVPKNVDKRKINGWAEPKGLTWNWDEKRLKKLLSDSYEVYFMGGAHNAFDLKKNFDKCYYLNADEKTIIERLNKRQQEQSNYHDYGNTEEQKRKILSRLPFQLTRAKREGFEIVDASLTFKQIFDLITKNVNAPVNYVQ